MISLEMSVKRMWRGRKGRCFSGFILTNTPYRMVCKASSGVPMDSVKVNHVTIKDGNTAREMTLKAAIGEES